MLIEGDLQAFVDSVVGFSSVFAESVVVGKSGVVVAPQINVEEGVLSPLLMKNLSPSARIEIYRKSEIFLKTLLRYYGTLTD